MKVSLSSELNHIIKKVNTGGYGNNILRTKITIANAKSSATLSVLAKQLIRKSDAPVIDGLPFRNQTGSAKRSIRGSATFHSVTLIGGSSVYTGTGSLIDSSIPPLPGGVDYFKGLEFGRRYRNGRFMKFPVLKPAIDNNLNIVSRNIKEYILNFINK